MVVALVLLALRPASAQPAPHDPTLPSVKPPALQELADTRTRQAIMLESQRPYANRCVCPDQTRDARGRSCRGRHEVIRTGVRPLCTPGQVTEAMIEDWRRRHP